MIEVFIEWLAGVPDWLAVMILAAIPVVELRGALPVALTWYDLPLWPAIGWSVLGNMLPVYFLLVLLEKIVPWSRMRSQYAAKFWDWLFARTRVKLETKVARYGWWALAIFVAVPLPVTGAWTGAAAAFVFGLPKTKAFFSILTGVIIAAVIVATLTMGARFTINSIF